MKKKIKSYIGEEYVDNANPQGAVRRWCKISNPHLSLYPSLSLLQVHQTMRLASCLGLAMVTNGWKLARYSKHIKKRVAHADEAPPEANDGKMSTKCDDACQRGTPRGERKNGTAQQ